MPDNPWLDIRNWGAGFGIAYGVWTYLSNRRESQLEALTEILEAMGRAHQALAQANTARRSCERLKESFAELDENSEAKQRIQMFYNDYKKFTDLAVEKYREAEILLFSKNARFSEKVAATNKAAFDVLQK